MEEYLDKMGLGACTLERGVVGCCPWLFCAVHDDDVEEDHPDTGGVTGMDAVDESVLALDVSRESEESKLIAKEFQSQEPNTAATSTTTAAATHEEEHDNPKAEDILQHNWTLCGINHHELEEDESQIIDWNGGATVATRDTTVAQDSKKQSKLLFQLQKQSSEAASEESKPVTVAQRLAQKMGLSTDKTDKKNSSQVVFQDAEEDNEETQEDAIAKAEDAIHAMNLPTLTQTCQNEQAIQSTGIKIHEDSIEDFQTVSSTPEKTDSAPSTPSKTPPSSAPSTPLKAAIVQDDSSSSPLVPSTPTSVAQRMLQASQPKMNDTAETDMSIERGEKQKVIQEMEEEGIEQGIDDQPPSIPSTPLKAVIPSTPLPVSTQSTPLVTEGKSFANNNNNNDNLSVKQKFARAMMKLKKDGARKEDKDATDITVKKSIDGAVSSSVVSAEQPPSIPSTPLKAEIPSTPLPQSNPSTPLVGAAAAAAVSVGAISVAAVQEEVSEAVEEGIESADLQVAEGAAQPPAIPSTPLTAAIPSTTTLPSSAKTTPAEVTPSPRTSVTKRFARVMKLKAKTDDEEATQVDAIVDKECVAPAMDTNVGEEVSFIRDESPHKSTLVPSTPSNYEPGQVINASDLLTSKSSSSPITKIGMLARAIKSRKNVTNNDDESEERPVDVNVDEGGVEGSVVPSLPKETVEAKANSNSAEADDALKQSDEEMEAPTTPMLRLVKAMSFHSQASKSQAEVNAAHNVPPSLNDTDKKETITSNINEPVDSAPTPLSNPPCTVVEPEEQPKSNPSTFGLLHVVAQAMSFTAEANGEERKDSAGSTVDTERNDKSGVDPTVAIDVNDADDIVDDDDDDIISSPAKEAVSDPEVKVDSIVESEIVPSQFGVIQMLGLAMSFMTEDNSAKEKCPESKPDACLNGTDDDVKAASEADANEGKDLDEIAPDAIETKSSDPPTNAHASDKSARPMVAEDHSRTGHISEITDEPINVTRELSIATQRVNNKTASDIVGSGDNLDETPGSIEYTPEQMLAVNQISNSKSRYKLYNLRPKSIGLITKAKSKKKDKLAANETKSYASVSTVPSGTNSVSINSVAVSDFTEKVDNLSSKKQNHKASKNSTKSKRQKRWREYTDPNTGKKYYSNGTTTTWTKPTNFAVESSSIDSAKPSQATDQSNGQKANKTSSKENKSNIKSDSMKKSGLAILFKSRPRIGKTRQPDDLSVCTDNITTNSEGNVSVISSPSKSVNNDNDNCEREVTKVHTLDESSPISANMLTTDCEGKVANTTLTLNPDSNNDNLRPNDVDLKPKKKKKRRKKGWREYSCPNTGKKYYSNGTITTWEKPAEFQCNDDNQEEVAKPFACENGKRVTIISFA